jgi:hypothetical protein
MPFFFFQFLIRGAIKTGRHFIQLGMFSYQSLEAERGERERERGRGSGLLI